MLVQILSTGGAKVEMLVDNDGSDSYNLGGGSDIYTAVGAATDDSDTVDGGAGTDLYDASLAADDLFINLDTTAHADAGTNIIANTAYGLDVSGSATPLDTDTVRNFENANGGGGDDIIYGSSAANVLTGSDGEDSIYGYAGNDTLDGGLGDDTLVGDVGNDMIRRCRRHR